MSEIDEIYKLYFKDVFLYLSALCKNESLAEELTQETFFKALSAINRFYGKKDIRAWLFTIAKNTYFSYCRRKDIPTAELPEQPVHDVVLTEGIENKEQAMQIHKILHSLEEPYKEVFSLRVFGELDFESIGEIFGKSSVWARVTYFRAKNKIIEQMGGISS